MTTPPFEFKQVPQDTLNHLFDEVGGENRLRACERFEFYNKPTSPDTGLPIGTSTIGYRYIENGIPIADVFHFEGPDRRIIPIGGRNKRSKRLLIDRIYYYV